jgi:hypothetical protein
LLKQTWNLEARAAVEPSSQPRAKSAFNMRPKNHGGAKYFSGAENNDNTILPSQTSSTTYYRGRQSQIRKSIAYSPPRKDFLYKETPGQSSTDFVLHNNNEKY